MGMGIGLILAFVAGAGLMFVTSEHYYKRIEAILGMKEKKKATKRAELRLIDARQAEAFEVGQPIRTRIERRP